VKGAFTDAKSDRKGMFELASGGSILLDEIGDMDPNLQSKLLRVIEDRSIWRVGGKAPIPVDVTVIATISRMPSKRVGSERTSSTGCTPSPSTSHRFGSEEKTSPSSPGTSSRSSPACTTKSS
jgi:Mg-chelatase subunit ChlI